MEQLVGKVRPEVGEQGQHVQLPIAGRVVLQVVADQGVEVRRIARIEHLQRVGPGEGVGMGQYLPGDVHVDLLAQPGGVEQVGAQVGQQAIDLEARDLGVQVQAEAIEQAGVGALGPVPAQRLEEGIEFLQFIPGHRGTDDLGGHQARDHVADQLAGPGVEVPAHALPFAVDGGPGVHHVLVGVGVLGVQLDAEVPPAGPADLETVGAQDLDLAAEQPLHQLGGAPGRQAGELDLDPDTTRLAVGIAGFGWRLRRHVGIL